MKVLMISLDKTLLGADYSGDALERHQVYAQRAGHLEVIVFSGRGFREADFGNLKVYPTNSFSKLRYLADGLRIANNLKFDLVVCQDPFLTAWLGWKIKKKFRVPLLIHFHGDFWDNPYWLKEKYYNPFLLWLSKSLVKKADGLRVMSSGIKEKLVKAGIDSEKIRVISTPIDLAKFKERREEVFENKKKMIINVGRPDPAKDYQTLFRAIELIYQQNKNIVFCQIGAGFDLRKKIKADQGLRLISEGKIKQEELIGFYRSSYVYLSSSSHESFGKVLVEAMACGVPLVATATTGSKEIIVNNQNGFLVPIGQSQALAEKVLYLLNNPARARQMGQQGRQMAQQKFSREKNINQIIAFWRDLAG